MNHLAARIASTKPYLGVETMKANSMTDSVGVIHSLATSLVWLFGWVLLLLIIGGAF